MRHPLRLMLILLAATSAGCLEGHIDLYYSDRLEVDPPSSEVSEMIDLRDALIAQANGTGRASLVRLFHPEHRDSTISERRLARTLASVTAQKRIVSTETIEAFYADFTERMPREVDGLYSYTASTVSSEILGSDVTLRSAVDGRAYYLLSRCYFEGGDHAELLLQAKKSDGSLRLTSFMIKPTDIHGRNAETYAEEAIELMENGSRRAAYLYREIAAALAFPQAVPSIFRELNKKIDSVPPDGMPRVGYSQPVYWSDSVESPFEILDVRPYIGVDTHAVQVAYRTLEPDPELATIERRRVFSLVARKSHELRDSFDGIYVLSVSLSGAKAGEYIPSTSDL